MRSAGSVSESGEKENREGDKEKMKETIDIKLKLKASGRCLRGFLYPDPHWMYFAGYIEALEWVLADKDMLGVVQNKFGKVKI
jgi:hypothetical protein